MQNPNPNLSCVLSIIIPCYNEEKTIEKCINRILAIEDKNLILDIIIVDDCSTDNSFSIANKIASKYNNIKLFQHDENTGKGAALRTGISKSKGDFVAIQDADLEYDPQDLKRLIVPLIEGKADVVFGSRFLFTGAHRVLYFWHSIGNRFLTFLSNMFTDLNLTDMETCYKVFRRNVIQAIEIKENRFGFEPEIVAKVAQMRLRIFEMGISYYGRTYDEGKKIKAKDGLRALYCIFHYNAHKAPLPIQLFLYLVIGFTAAIANIVIFYILQKNNISIHYSALTAFILAAALNYFLCISILFRHKAKWGSKTEITIYLLLVSVVCLIDIGLTKFFVSMNFQPIQSKIFAIILSFILNFVGRRFLVFPEASSGPWQPIKN